MNKKLRKQFVIAMDQIARSCGDEQDLMHWLSMGVADGDIDYTDECNPVLSDDDAIYYTQDDTFADLMHRFLLTMHSAYKHYGGLYVDGVVDKELPDNCFVDVLRG